MSKTSFKWNIDKALITRETNAAVKKGIFKACDHLAAESKKQVPLDQGTLKMSCKVSQTDDGKTGCVSYDTPYAVIQHEVLWYNHQRGRKAKYLEDPINDPVVQADMNTLMANEFKKRM